MNVTAAAGQPATAPSRPGSAPPPALAAAWRRVGREWRQAGLALIHSPLRYLVLMASLILLLGLHGQVELRRQALSQERHQAAQWLGQDVAFLSLQTHDAFLVEFNILEPWPRQAVTQLLESQQPALLWLDLAPRQRLLWGQGRDERSADVKLAVVSPGTPLPAAPRPGAMSCSFLGPGPEVAAGTVLLLPGAQWCQAVPLPQGWGALQVGQLDAVLLLRPEQAQAMLDQPMDLLVTRAVRPVAGWPTRLATPAGWQWEQIPLTHRPASSEEAMGRWTQALRWTAMGVGLAALLFHWRGQLPRWRLENALRASLGHSPAQRWHWLLAVTGLEMAGLMLALGLAMAAWWQAGWHPAWTATDGGLLAVGVLTAWGLQALLARLLLGSREVYLNE
jgi:hypothetical protein